MEMRGYVPILFRNEIIDFFFPFTDHANRHGLYTPRTKSPFNLVPKKWAYLVTNQAVENSSCLLSFIFIEIQFSGVAERLQNRVFGKIVK
ncbi:MAG: hypothetical protein A4E66_01602 [Syntrophus sp. PtaB.Bin001]|nr:MAG: hypothetical protein A4E66_01602 [Syntrophus sp. PtaB.Bin001]